MYTVLSCCSYWFIGGAGKLYTTYIRLRLIHGVLGFIVHVFVTLCILYLETPALSLLHSVVKRLKIYKKERVRLSGEEEW